MSEFDPKRFRFLNGKLIEQRIVGNIFRYDCYSLNNDLSATRHGLFSETDLYTLPQNIAGMVFDSKKMEECEFLNGGYMGKIDQNGQIVTNPQTLSFFRDAVGIKEK